MTDRHGDTGDLSANAQQTLRCIARQMIPASAEYGVPGADDPIIFTDILQSIDRDRALLQEALHVVDAMAGGSLVELPEAGQVKRLMEFRTTRPDLAAAIEAAVARCYYRDDRVMASIGMEARPPFPIGYKVKEGDWSMLDPVRARGKIYRDTGLMEESS